MYEKIIEKTYKKCKNCGNPIPFDDRNNPICVFMNGYEYCIECFKKGV